MRECTLELSEDVSGLLTTDSKRSSDYPYPR